MQRRAHRFYYVPLHTVMIENWKLKIEKRENERVSKNNNNIQEERRQM